MHELAIAQGIVELASEAAKGKRVRSVNVEIGAASGVLPEAVTFSFELVAEGTCVQGAFLNILEIPAAARCENCGGEFAVTSTTFICDCGSFRHILVRGGELLVRSIEVEPEST